MSFPFQDSMRTVSAGRFVLQDVTTDDAELATGLHEEESRPAVGRRDRFRVKAPTRRAVVDWRSVP